MSNKEKAWLVPKLRFREFRDAGGWIQKPLGDIGEIVTGKTPSTSDESLWNGEIQFVTPTDISEEKYQWETQRSVSSHAVAKVLPKHSTMFTCIASIGKMALSVKPCITNQQINSIVPSTDFEPEFVYYSLLSIVSLIKSTQSNSTLPIINKTDFSKIPISVPKQFAEQQKVSDCLGSLDELIAAQARKVDALKTHKRGLMQQLFPRDGETQPRRRFPEFLNAGEWTLQSIQELIDKKFIVGHLDGNHGSLYPRSEEFSDSGVPYISATSFHNGGIDFGRCKFLPEERAAQFKKGIARDGDILFAHNATVGPVAKLTTKCDFVILSTSLTYFRCNRALLSSDFLQCALVSPAFVDQCARVMSQSTRNQIPITTQRTFSLQIPTLPEQIRIADGLSSLGDLITTATQELDALRTHKKGLMQQLFPSKEAVET